MKMLCNSQGLRAPARDVAAGDASRPEESQHPVGRRVARGRGGGQGVRLRRVPQRRRPYVLSMSRLSWYTLAANSLLFVSHLAHCGCRRHSVAGAGGDGGQDLHGQGRRVLDRRHSVGALHAQGLLRRDPLHEPTRGQGPVGRSAADPRRLPPGLPPAHRGLLGAETRFNFLSTPCAHTRVSCCVVCATTGRLTCVRAGQQSNGQRVRRS